MPLCVYEFPFMYKRWQSNGTWMSQKRRIKEFCMWVCVWLCVCVCLLVSFKCCICFLISQFSKAVNAIFPSTCLKFEMNAFVFVYTLILGEIRRKKFFHCLQNRRKKTNNDKDRSMRRTHRKRSEKKTLKKTQQRNGRDYRKENWNCEMTKAEL